MKRSPVITILLVLILVLLAERVWRNTRGKAGTVPQAAPAGTTAAHTPANALTMPPVPAMLSAEETRTIDIFERVSPSVVSVANKALMRAGWFSPHVVEVPQGSGSGFVWDAEGHILSNYHVVHGASALTVTFPDGQSYDARLIGSAPDYDLAVLKIDPGERDLAPLVPGTSRTLRVGQSVLAIGNPFGLDTSLSKGIVSALGRTMVSMSQRRISDVIQTDAAINPGNSGGPLLDMNGRLVGVNTAILSPSGAHAGIGFAVPADTVARITPQLIAKGHVTRAGIGAQLLSDAIMRRNGVDGVGVYAVVPGQPADKAGIQGVRTVGWGTFMLGDVITAVNGKPVANKDDLRDILDPLAPGGTVDVTLTNNGRERTVTVGLIETN